MRLLVVEDNEELAELLAKGLRTAGYQADILSTVEEATSVLDTTFYAALILDLGLPDGDGLALLREIRHRNNPIPVLVLTARGGLHDRVLGLRSGADDYLVKPFALEELVARLEAQLRRPGHLLGSSLRIANLEFDTRNRQASIDEQPQLLSARETAVLELLMRSKGRVVSKKQVEDHIFGHSGEVASNAIEVYVHRLRKQLSERGAKVQVHTIRGSDTSSQRRSSVIRFQSIISRIVILHVVAVVITSIFMSLALSWLLSYATDNIHNEAMQEQAVTVGEHLSAQPDGRLELNLPLDLLGLYSQAYGRYLYAVTDDQGRVLFSSLQDHAALFPVDARSGDVEFLQQRRGDATVSGASIKKTIGSQTVWIQTGENLANRDVLIDDIVADFYKNVGWITLPILLVLLIADIAIFRRALRPLWQASEIARDIGPTRTDLRLPTEEIPREVRPLVSAINLALDRLEEGFRIQRDFTADAAHELRTPLSILRTRLDLLEDEQTSRALRQDVEGMAHIISQLLDMAELDAFVVDPLEKADLRSVTAEVAEFVAPLALAQGKDIALVGETEPVWIRGNPEMLSRAIRNLAENAINHTAPGTTVEFAVDRDRTVSVLDHGPGVAENERNLVFQRFWRRDRSKAGSTGLGLSIVQRIAELHSATITLENRRPAGACFSLKFIPLRA